jgi:spermidine synthase
MQKQANRLAVFIPRITVFISSACIMIIEIVAGRMIARYLGSTLYVWTSVIGVVLGGIAIGNYIGGKIADAFPSRKTLAVLFGISSVACVVTIILNFAVGEWQLLALLPLPIHSLLHVALVFLLPSALLGTISPVIAKMALDLGLPQGNTIGSVYAWSAAGSILGTFLAGFVLISLMGTAAIVWTIGAILLLLGIAFWFRFIPFYPWAALFMVLAMLGVAPFNWAVTAGSAVDLRARHDSSVLYEKESEYCYIAVEQLSKTPDTRQFVQDDQKSHSRIIMSDIENLQYTYTQTFAAITEMLATPTDTRSFLSIGGGGFVFPRYLATKYPKSTVDSVEIDPAVTEAAIAAFGLARNSSIRIHNADARNYVKSLAEEKKRSGSSRSFDFIYGDAFGASFVPFQLVTKEYNDMIRSLLSPNGAYIVNTVDVYTSGEFLGAFINTMRKTFPFVYVISEHMHFIMGSNFVIVGSNREIDIKKIRPNKQLAGKDIWFLDIYQVNSLVRKASGKIFTDDYAPVEQLLSPFFDAHARYLAAQKYIEEGDLLLSEGKVDECIRSYEETIKRVPEMSIVLYSKIGEVYSQSGNWDQVVKAGLAAIEYNDRAPELVSVSELRYTIGIILVNMKKNNEGIAQMKKAIDDMGDDLSENPDSVNFLYKRGNAYMYTGEIASAIESFTHALAVDEENVDARTGYAIALLLEKKYDRAKALLAAGLALASKKGDESGIAQLKDFLDHFEERKKEYSVSDNL